MTDITQPGDLKSLVEDIDQLLGIDGKFWDRFEADRFKLETPEQVKELARDTLKGVFGLEVRGL